MWCELCALNVTREYVDEQECSYLDCPMENPVVNTGDDFTKFSPKPSPSNPDKEPNLKTRQDFIDAILGMNHGELKGIAEELATTIEDKEVRPKLETAEEFADLLFDWADAQRST